MPPSPPTPWSTDGVRLLVDGRPDDAARAFHAALAGDAHLVDHTGFAVALAELGDVGIVEHLRGLSDRAVPQTSAERHHVEIVTLALSGRVDRASVLGREHLLAVPDDDLVRHLLVRWCPDSDDLVG